MAKWEKLEKKKTGPIVFSPQPTTWLLSSNDISCSLLERERKMLHVSLLRVMAGSAYSNITACVCAHMHKNTYTHMQAHPKNPLLCDDRLQLSAHSTATLTHFPSLSPLTVYITLSPHSQPPQIPPTPLLPLLLFPCSGEWVTSLTPSVSGPSCLFESLSTSIKRLIEKAVFALTRL